MGTRNLLIKNDGTDHLYHHAKFGGNRATHVGVRGPSVMFFTLSRFFFENNAVGRRPLWCVVELLPQDIASVFVGRFRCCLHRFFAEEKLFPAYWTVLKIFARGRYDWCPNGPNKIENLRKWVQSLCAPLRPFRSKMEENFYHSLLPHIL